MPTQLILRLPLPPLACSPNVASHLHWRYRQQATKDYRQMSKQLAEIEMDAAEWTPAPIVIATEWFMGLSPREIAIRAATKGQRLNTKQRAGYAKVRPLDAQNAIASLKAAVDGIVDAGIVPSDSHKWVQWGECILHRTAKEHGGVSSVVIRIERRDDD